VHVENLFEPELVAYWRERMRRFQLGELGPKDRPKLDVVAGQEVPVQLKRGEGTENLITLALWLRSESVAASRAASTAQNHTSRQKSLEAAARLERAGDIVKEYADLLRKQREKSQARPRRA
jgi:hypothetical protein